MYLQSLTVSVIRWAARALALATFLFLGWLFAVRIVNWPMHPWPLTPPLSIWVGQALFLLLLAGLLIGLRWELAGGLLVVGAAVPLFATTIPDLTPLAILPGILYLACALGQQWVDVRAVTGTVDEPVESKLTAA